jgi:hypothetical protein
MSLTKKQFRLQPIAEIRATSVPWRSDGLLVLVQGGMGALRWERRTAKDGNDQRVLYLKDVPLLLAQSDSDCGSRKSRTTTWQKCDVLGAPSSLRWCGASPLETGLPRWCSLP